MKRVWSVQTWEPGVIAEYRRALLAVGDAGLVVSGVDEAVTSTQGKFAPSVGDLMACVERCRVRAKAIPKAGRVQHVSVTAAALEDAINALEVETDPDYAKEIEGQIARLRKRLSDHGAQTDERMRTKVRFLRGRSLPGDPKGTVRLRVLQATSLRVQGEDAA